MRRNLPHFAKYLIGASLALIAVSNCFNVMSNSSLFGSSSSDVSRSETKPWSEKLGRTTSASSGLDSSGKFQLNSVLNPRNGRVIGPWANKVLKSSMALPAGPTISATKTYTPSGNANPGDTLMYSIVISNTGTMDALGVTLTDTIDPNTTLVAGSVIASPIAVDDKIGRAHV